MVIGFPVNDRGMAMKGKSIDIIDREHPLSYREQSILKKT